MNKKTKSRFLNEVTLTVVGTVLIILAAILLLWHGNATSNQASQALVARIYFDGEYRIADGSWQNIVKGQHIPSTDGDVTLRGNFHILAPDGEYVGIFSGDMPVALYLNHINLTFYEDGNATFITDIEDRRYGDSTCGEAWTAYTLTSQSEEPIEIVIHNPHKFGNETAIDKMLENVEFWTGIDFEKNILNRGETQRNIGVLFVFISLLFLGSALFTTLIHIHNSKILWILGAVILFAGTYLTFSSDSVSFWSESIVTNTIAFVGSMIFYMLFLSMAIVYFLKGTKKVGVATVAILGVFDAILFVLPIFTDILFYDTFPYWAAAQTLASIILVGCIFRDFASAKEKERWLYIGPVVPLLAFVLDIIMIDLGIWKNGRASMYIFVGLFIAATVAILKVIPNSINTLAKAKELETERIILNSQLTESRVATMMSQIRPHFIYNTLGSIEQLCYIDSPKAGELVHNFAKYLRGNFGEFDNPNPIPMSQEMAHVHYYISIEKVRFPDMTFSFEMNSEDFQIPALTIQPIVENAIKHGLMKLEKGGTIGVVSYETDTHYCVSVKDDGVGFDTSELLMERNHVGIRNIRGRLKEMVNGSLEIESEVGVGTTVLIKIPKEAEK